MQRNKPPTPAVHRDRWIDIDELELLCCMKKSSIYAKLRDGRLGFPQPVRLSSRMSRWSEQAVLQWMQEQSAAGAANSRAILGTQQ